MFLHVCVILFTGGECLTRHHPPPRDQAGLPPPHPRTREVPPVTKPPLGTDPPDQGGIPPGPDPPRPGRNPPMTRPPQDQTPHPPPRTREEPPQDQPPRPGRTPPPGTRPPSPVQQTPEYGQRSAGTHPTGVHSCLLQVLCMCSCCKLNLNC